MMNILYRMYYYIDNEELSIKKKINVLKQLFYDDNRKNFLGEPLLGTTHGTNINIMTENTFS